MPFSVIGQFGWEMLIPILSRAGCVVSEVSRLCQGIWFVQ